MKILDYILARLSESLTYRGAIFLDYILARLSESSTYRGAIFLLGSFGIAVAPDKANAIVAASMAIVGAINVIRKSK
jgi:hypothetical protein